MSQEKSDIGPAWKANISFIPFASEAQRDQAYRNWVNLFLKAEQKATSGRVDKGTIRDGKSI